MISNVSMLCRKILLVKAIIVFTSFYFESFLLDLINQHHSLFTTKFIFMLKAF